MDERLRAPARPAAPPLLPLLVASESQLSACVGSGLGLGLGLGLGSGEVERHRLDVHGQLSLHRLADELLHLVRARGVNEGLGCG